MHAMKIRFPNGGSLTAEVVATIGAALLLRVAQHYGEPDGLYCAHAGTLYDIVHWYRDAADREYLYVTPQGGTRPSPDVVYETYRAFTFEAPEKPGPDCARCGLPRAYQGFGSRQCLCG